MQPFHLALTVNDLTKAERFYVDVLGCKIGRQAETWIDFDLFGHQVSLHLDPEHEARHFVNPVDEKPVPLPHFGVVLPMPAWRELAQRLTAAGTDFVIEPYIRFEGQVGEQGTLFFLDPAGNALEFKGFARSDALFESE